MEDKLIDMNEVIEFQRQRREEERKRPSKQELETERLYRQCFDHIAGKRSFRDEYKLILEKRSTLPTACRNFIVEQAKGWEEEK